MSDLLHLHSICWSASLCSLEQVVPEYLKKRNKQTSPSNCHQLRGFSTSDYSLSKEFPHQCSCVPRTAILHFVVILKTSNLERCPTPQKYIMCLMRKTHFIEWLIMCQKFYHSWVIWLSKQKGHKIFAGCTYNLCQLYINIDVCTSEEIYGLCPIWQICFFRVVWTTFWLSSFEWCEWDPRLE